MPDASFGLCFAPWVSVFYKFLSFLFISKPIFCIFRPNLQRNYRKWVVMAKSGPNDGQAVIWDFGKVSFIFRLSSLLTTHFYISRPYLQRNYRKWAAMTKSGTNNGHK